MNWTVFGAAMTVIVVCIIVLAAVIKYLLQPPESNQKQNPEKKNTSTATQQAPRQDAEYQNVPNGFEVEHPADFREIDPEEFLEEERGKRFFAYVWPGFEKCFEEVDIPGMLSFSDTVLRHTPRNKGESMGMHFALMFMAQKFYQLRDIDSELLTVVEMICKRDLDLIPDLNERLKGCSWYCLTRLCILYERSDRLQEAIEICDIGNENGFLDSGNSFLIRKARLEKKLARAAT